MTTTIRISGMSCGHCSGRVKNALQKTDGVLSAEVSLEKGTAVVVHEESITAADIIAVIEDAGYEASES